MPVRLPYLLLVLCLPQLGCVGSVADPDVEETESDTDTDTDTDTDSDTDSDTDTDTDTDTDAPPPVDHTYVKNDGPNKNPLKGWNASWWVDKPEASVGFQYISWKDLEPTNGTFDWDQVEERLNRPGTRGRHAILRLNCDWYGDNEASDGPQWLYTDEGVARLKGENGRYITDYNDPAFIREATQAIEALADRYDDDPRMFAIQVGVIGYFGEWHTFGSKFDGDSFEITSATQNAVLDAYTLNFERLHIIGRYPWREPLKSSGVIGFHNDYFVPNNGHSHEFDTAIDSGEQWKNGPVGGEVPPRDDDVDVDAERAALFAGGQGLSMIETGHYSTMAPGVYRQEAADPAFEDYMKLHKKMGYNYQIDRARFPETVTVSDTLQVEVTGSNIGVAPMYYDWDVQIGLLAGDDLVAGFDVDQALTAIQPEAPFTFAADVPLTDLEPGTYRVAIRLMQPDADEARDEVWALDARNTYIEFANDLTVVDGQWGTDGALIGGWSVLGEVAVE